MNPPAAVFHGGGSRLREPSLGLSHFTAHDTPTSSRASFQPPQDKKIMALPKHQTGIVQSASAFSPDNPTTISISSTIPMPILSSPGQVFVRVLAVALNPSDFKMIKYFPQPGTNLPAGCDFCGVIEDVYSSPESNGTRASSPLQGTRVIGSKFPYGATEHAGAGAGAFAEYLVADSSQLIAIPDSMDELQGAAIGGLCWGTCVVALFADAEGLRLPFPESLTEDENAEGAEPRSRSKSYPVLVYGAATATGTMACQMLRL